MITINKAPELNKVILDANNSVISITSSNGAGHYFRVSIYIDGVLFDIQSWSRKNAYTAEKNIKKLYNAYFEYVFQNNFTNGLTAQTHLIKRVNISIEERLMADDTLVAVLSLPRFYIMYNNSPVLFNDTTSVQFLGVPAEKMLIPPTGKISIPFFANTNNQTIVVTLKDNFNNTINSATIAASSEKKSYLYNYNLSNASLPNNTIYFTLTITVGTTTITQIFRNIVFADYPVKELAYLNNFGYYIYTYFDGQLSIDKSLSIESFEQQNGSEKIIEINQEDTYIINSGSLLGSEKNVLTEIVNALQAKLFYTNKWIDIVTKTKKIKTYQDRANNYSENLQFMVSGTTDIDNDFGVIQEDSEVPSESSEVPSSEPPISSEPASSEPAESEVPTEARVTLNSVAVSLLSPAPEGEFCLDVSITLDAGYNPTNVIVIVTPEGEAAIEISAAVDDPILVCSFVPGNYTVTIKEVGTGLLSNSISYTIP
jgi:hypothetical protein